MEIPTSNDFILEGTYGRTYFESYFQPEDKILHVLDAMGDDPLCKSVTNSIHEMLPDLEKVYKLKDGYRVFLYGTDCVITEYTFLNDGFRLIPKTDKQVFSIFLERMIELYR